MRRWDEWRQHEAAVCSYQYIRGITLETKNVQLLSLAHYSTTNGHVNGVKTFFSIVQRYFGPNIIRAQGLFCVCSITTTGVQRGQSDCR